VPKVALSKFAQYDLEAIEVDGFLKFGRFQRDKYTLSLLETLENIGNFPQMGLATSRPNIRRFVHWPHLIFYSIKDDQILIQRIVDGRIHDPERGI